MYETDEYTEDAISAAIGDAGGIESRADEALDNLDGGPSSGEIQDALNDLEDALDRLRGGRYGSGGVPALAEGADVAYNHLEEVRAIARRMGDGLAAAEDRDQPAAETEFTLHGQPYRIRIDPMEEVETDDLTPEDDE